MCSLDLRPRRAGRPVTFDRFDDGGAEVSRGDEVLNRVPRLAEVLVHVEPDPGTDRPVPDAGRSV